MLLNKTLDMNAPLNLHSRHSTTFSYFLGTILDAIEVRVIFAISVATPVVTY